MLDFTPLASFHDARAEEALATYRADAEAEGLSLFATVAADTLFVMGHDADGTVFFPPEALSDNADRDEAFLSLEEFAGAACVPIVFVGLSADEADEYALRYPEHEIYEMDDGVFAFSAVTPLSRIENLPVRQTGDVTLSAPTEADRAFYEDLKRDCRGSLYGYGVAPGKSLFEAVSREWRNRAAMAYVIRVGDAPLGEVTLYSFDGHGGARVAVRMLRSARRRGYAKAALKETFAFAFDTLRLSRLYADVDEKNVPSLSLFSDLMVESGRAEGAVHFYRNL